MAQEAALVTAKPLPSARGGWYVALLLFFCNALAFVHRGVIGVLVQPIRHDLGLTDVQFGTLQGPGFAISFACASLFIGRLADIWRRRELLILGLVFWIGGTLSCAAASSFFMFLAGRTMIGIGIAAVLPIAISLLGDVFEGERRARPIGLFFAGALVGDPLAVLAGGGLLELVQPGGPLHFLALAPWRQVLILTCLPGIPLLAALLFLRDPERRTDPQVDPTHRDEGLRYLLVNWWLFLPYLAAVSLATLAGAAAYWVPEILQRSYGLSPARVATEYGPVLMATGLGSAAFGIIVGGMIGRKGVRAGFLTAAIAYGAGGVGMLLFLQTHVSGAYAANIMFVFADGLAGILLANSIQTIIPASTRATVAALERFCAVIIGFGLGQPLAAFIGEQGSKGPDQLAIGMLLVAVPALALSSALFLLVSVASRRLVSGS